MNHNVTTIISVSGRSTFAFPTLRVTLLYASATINSADFMKLLTIYNVNIINEKALRETQTLRARRSPPHRRTESAMAVVRLSQKSPHRRPPSLWQRTAKI